MISILAHKSFTFLQFLIFFLAFLDDDTMFDEKEILLPLILIGL